MHSKMTDNLVGCLQVKDRNQIIKKLIQYQIVQLYTQHKIEEGLVKYDSVTDANRVEVGVVWDEFWSFYDGIMETSTGNDVGVYVNAESRIEFFPSKSCTSLMASASVQSVPKIIFLFVFRLVRSICSLA